MPGLVLALKLIVDADPRPGRFLLTGSADLLRVPATEDSLAGRAESVELHGFSQGELEGRRERFIDHLLAGEQFIDSASDLNRHDYLERAVAGSYPEALVRSGQRRRNQWQENYLRRIVERDAPDVSRSHRLGDLPMILRLLAARNSEELNVAGIAGDVGIPTRSLAPLIDLLETLYLIQRIPAWSTNLSKRVVSRPKAALLDSGLAARLVNVSAAGMASTVSPELAGHLLEGFVAGELRRQLAWSNEVATMFHYRDHDGPEVDIVLETPDGRVAAIEVKAASAVRPRDAKWLTMLRDKLGRRFMGGVVLHTGSTGGSIGDRLSIAPIDALWRI